MRESCCKKRHFNVVSEQPCCKDDRFGSPVSGIPSRNDILMSFPGGEPGFDASCGSLEGDSRSCAATDERCRRVLAPHTFRSAGLGERMGRASSEMRIRGTRGASGVSGLRGRLMPNRNTIGIRHAPAQLSRLHTRCLRNRDAWRNIRLLRRCFRPPKPDQRGLHYTVLRSSWLPLHWRGPQWSRPSPEVTYPSLLRLMQSVALSPQWLRHCVRCLSSSSATLAERQ